MKKKRKKSLEHAFNAMFNGEIGLRRPDDGIDKASKLNEAFCLRDGWLARQFPQINQTCYRKQFTEKTVELD